jgi:hypothetical protein
MGTKDAMIVRFLIILLLIALLSKMNFPVIGNAVVDIVPVALLTETTRDLRGVADRNLSHAFCFKVLGQ